MSDDAYGATIAKRRLARLLTAARLGRAIPPTMPATS